MVDNMEWFNVFGLIFIAVIMIPNKCQRIVIFQSGIFWHFFITKIFDTQKGEERMWDLVTITTTGRATADVELKTSTNGKNTKYVQFGLAVNKGYWLLGSWEGFINHTRISLFIKRTCHWWTTWICKIISWWNDANMGGCRWHSLFIMLNNPQKF